MVENKIPFTEIYLNSAEPLSPMETLLAAYRHHEKLSKLHPEFPTQAWLFQTIVNGFWGPHNKTRRFDWNPWAEKLCEELHKHKYLAVCGCGNCLSGDTRLLNPITGESPTIIKLFLTNTQPTVMTLQGPEQASVPFLKGIKELFEVELSNGRKFQGTQDHLVLTPSGFSPLGSLAIGSPLLGYAPTLEVEHITVVSIQSKGLGSFYDLTVPKAAHYFAEGAIHHNSSKTTLLSIYGLIQWCCDPMNTLVLMTSTSIKDSKKRIWGSMASYYQAAGGDSAFPGRLVDSLHQIRTADGNGAYTDRAGIAIIAGEKKKERESVGKLIGLKSPRLFLIADELPELAESLFEAALSNLALNPHFQMVGLGNLWSTYDPLGTFARPKAGWGTVTVNDDEWETERGYCIRFDGEKSPNVLQGQDLYPHIYTNANLKEHRDKLGKNSIGYWRMCRSFIPPVGTDNVIYSEADFLAGDCYTHAIWRGNTIKIAALDPAFTSGGDRTVAYFGSWGVDVNGKNVLNFDEYVYLKEDVTIADQPRSQQIVRQFIDQCMKRGVRPEHAAMDASGAGRVIHDLISERWSPQVLDVEFGGAPSDLVSGKNGETAKDLYDRKVSELWYSGLDYVRSGQIKGIPPEVANEMRARQYIHIKGETLKVKVEPKTDMRSRIGYSPDMADAAFILLELCRQRLGAMAQLPGVVKAGARDSFLKRARELDGVHEALYSGQD